MITAGSFDSKIFTYFSFEEVLIEMIKITTSNTGTKKRISLNGLIVFIMIDPRAKLDHNNLGVSFHLIMTELTPKMEFYSKSDSRPVKLIDPKGTFGLFYHWLATYFYSHDGTVGCVKKQNKPAHEQPCAGAKKPSAD
ncbi:MULTISPECIES: hypothetical protein [Brevibacillus]|uniref:hypothetical protein n=1 Tax=Brevibacillus TaxID=55080 RepID=UPI00257FD778|nr:hypothetical protein [Brevibacillus sp.]